MYLIYGKNKVAQGVARLCTQVGISYHICDDSDAPESFDAYEAIIPSPGIPGTHRLYTSGKVVGEMDFAYRYMPRGFETTVITGTDGKSTTSWMLYSILQKEYNGKKNVYLSGNFDIPFSETVCQILETGQQKGYIVLEVSSFMGYGIGLGESLGHEPFAPDYAIFTNLKSDHLNWHRDLQEYLDAKMHSVAHSKKRAIINQQVFDFVRENGLKVLPLHNERRYSTDPQLTPRDWTDGDKIVISGRTKYHLSETHFSGIHNAMNILSVTLVTNEMGICSKRTKVYLTEIRGLPHRLEVIGENREVTVVEDSKSTSAQSLSAALNSFGTKKNLLLIVGGSDKGDSFTELEPLFAARVKAVACIGATKDQFMQIAQNTNIPHLATDSLSDAVNWLMEQSRAGDVLILSPGCASFGLFRDYLDRANQFRDIIKKLPE